MTFKDMAERGTGEREKVDNALEEIMAEAKKVKADEKIDSVFFWRFNRVLMVLKLSIIKDRESILGPLIEKEIGEFVEEITGEKFDIKGTKGIGKIAAAIAEEILNLHMYLDNRKNRDKIMEKYEKKLSMRKK